MGLEHGPSAPAARACTIQGKRYWVEQDLGRGSYGVVRGCATDEKEPVSVAVKDIVCRSRAALDQALYEFEILRKLRDHVGAHVGAPEVQLHYPRFIAVQAFAAGEGKWRVLGVMERAPGQCLDTWLERTFTPETALSLATAFVQQLAPTLGRLHEVALHRDIGPRNVLLSAGPSGEDPTFTLIDFGLGVDYRAWREGAWKCHDIGGDCRYWPSSAWMQFLFGHEYLSEREACREHYVHMLDHHAFALSAVQILARVDGDELSEVWDAYWSDATRVWKQLYQVFASGGDWAVLKAEFMRQGVQEHTLQGVARLRSTLAARAGPDAPLCRTLARLLVPNARAAPWHDVASLAAPAPVTSFAHARHRTDRRLRSVGYAPVSPQAEDESSALGLGAAIDGTLRRFVALLA